ncbi:hypothetical protein C8R47DRAFT_1072201 [Mycena vitilis]|nr:hypothetical protein C8R47DRAFT_1072201 [Mycena vitilis]
MTKRRSCHVDVFLPLPSSSPYFPSLNLSSPPIRRPWIAWPNSLKLLKDLVCCSPVPGPSNVDTSFTTVTVPTGRPGPTSIAIPIHDPARAAKPVAPHTCGNPGLLHPHCLPHATPLTPPSSLTTVKNNIYHENQGATRKSYPSQVNCSFININSTSNLTASVRYKFEPFPRLCPAHPLKFVHAWWSVKFQDSRRRQALQHHQQHTSLCHKPASPRKLPAHASLARLVTS